MPASLPSRHITRLFLGASVPRARLQPILPFRRPYASRPEPIDPAYPVDAPPTPSSKGPLITRPGAIVLGAFAAGIGLYTLQIVLAASQPLHNPAIAQLSAQKDVAAKYDETADIFDAEVGLSEQLMGLNRLRKKLARECKGDVLEVSCGTGRNLGYFDIEGGNARVQSLSFLDLSPKMVEVCRKKWDVLYGAKGREGKLKKGLKVRFLTGSALGAIPLAPARGDPEGIDMTEGEKKYDTIIQTMGICSTDRPGELVKNMARHLDTTSTDSRIFLLEHGRSYMPWLNRILDNSAEKHAELHGCWFNREIGDIVQEAARASGLEIVRERRWHFGTTWIYELRPSQETVAKAIDAVKREGSAETVVAPKGREEGWASRLGWQ